MEAVEVFKNREFGEIRTVVINNEPYFVGKDVAVILGYSNPRDAISKHVDEEDKGVAKCDTLGGVQDVVFINESGLYSLILRSKLPKARQFKRWVTSEVLPSIRKHGMYAVDELLENPDLLIKVATELKDERQRRSIAEKECEELRQDRKEMRDILLSLFQDGYQEWYRRLHPRAGPCCAVKSGRFGRGYSHIST